MNALFLISVLVLTQASSIFCADNQRVPSIIPCTINVRELFSKSNTIHLKPNSQRPVSYLINQIVALANAGLPSKKHLTASEVDLRRAQENETLDSKALMHDVYANSQCTPGSKLELVAILLEHSEKEEEEKKETHKESKKMHQSKKCKGKKK